MEAKIVGWDLRGLNIVGFKRVKRVTLNWAQCAANGPRQLVTQGLKGETRLNTCEDPTMKDTTVGQPRVIDVNRNIYVHFW